MPTYTAPGVYVEEVVSSQKVLTSAPTTITAFVGFTEKAPTDDPKDPQGVAPRLVTSWNQFESLYGGFAPGCVLPLSVYGYFANGGAIAYICRVPNTDPSGEPARLARLHADTRHGDPCRLCALLHTAGTRPLRADAARALREHDGRSRGHTGRPGATGAIAFL